MSTFTEACDNNSITSLQKKYLTACELAITMIFCMGGLQGCAHFANVSDQNSIQQPAQTSASQPNEQQTLGKKTENRDSKHQEHGSAQPAPGNAGDATDIKLSQVDSSEKVTSDRVSSKKDAFIAQNSEKKDSSREPSTSSESSSEKNLGEVSGSQSHWFKGSFSDALKQAQKSKKLIFLYWGAEWCPPCNDLKDQVFSHPDFPGLMKNYVAVYLDGDAPSAQALGDTLNVSGYPTMLLLNAKGKELFRLNAGYDFNEFKETLNAASRSSGSLGSVLAKLGKKKLTSSEWKVLMAASIEPDSIGLTPSETEELVIKLWKHCPSEYIEAKSVFAANLWGSIDEDSVKLKSIFSTNEDEILEQIFASGMTMDAARYHLMTGTKAKVLLLKQENKEKIRHHLATYLRGNAEDTNRPPSERASAFVSSLELDKLSPRYDKTKESKDFQAIIDSILALSKSSHEKAATYPEIAMAYQDLYGAEKAVSFLESKISDVKSPWYLESMLASLESEQNNKEKALIWSEKATKSSKGAATRLQWLSKDIVLKGKYLEPTDNKLTDAIRSFFAESSQATDSFKGRNEASHKRVAEVIKKLGSAGLELSAEAIKLCGDDTVCQQIYQAH